MSDNEHDENKHTPPAEIPPPPFDKKTMQEMFRLSDETYADIVRKCEERTGRKYQDLPL